LILSESLQSTIAIVKKFELALTSEIVAQESKDKSKRKRSAGNSPSAGYRSRS